MHPIDLLQWWNLIFDLPFIAALIPLLLQATGAAHFGHGGHGMHVGHGAPSPSVHHIHLPHVHLPHVGHHEIAAGSAHVATGGASAVAPAHAVAGHAQAGHHPSHGTQGAGPIGRALSVLGVGKVPIMMVFSSFCFLWGFSGLAANLLLAGVFVLPSLFILPSIGLALVSSFVLTSILSQGISKVMPSVETYTTPREAFVGKTGHALYEINRQNGAAVVLDNESNRVQIKCCTEQGGGAIPRGHSLSITRYDDERAIFIVEEVLLTDSDRAQLTQFEKRLKESDPAKKKQAQR